MKSRYLMLGHKYEHVYIVLNMYMHIVSITLVRKYTLVSNIYIYIYI